MKEEMARDLSARLLACWPECLQASVIECRTGKGGYAVSLMLPRYHRCLRVARPKELPGVLDICSVLLGEPVKAANPRKRKEQPMERTETIPDVPKDEVPHQPTGKPKRAYRRAVPDEKQETARVAEVEPPADTVVGEKLILQELIGNTFAIPGIISLGRISEVPRTWKIDAMTTRGPESYRVVRDITGVFQWERW